MADREAEYIAKIASSVAGLNGAAWDRLGAGDPFLSHALSLWGPAAPVFGGFERLIPKCDRQG